MNKIMTLFAGIVFATAALAQSTDQLSGEWLLRREMFGQPWGFHRITFTVDKGKVTGTFASGRKLEGTLEGNVLHFTSREGQGTIECTATINGGAISGKFIETNLDNARNVQESVITGARLPPPRSGPAQRHEFIPKTFYREFSPLTPPVLHIWPGDTIHTTTVDAGGTDERGVRRSFGGNPETGPFFIESTWPGDTLVIHFSRIRLNRDYAISDDGIVDRALDSDMAVKMKDVGKTVRWHLDLERMIGTTELPGDHLKNFSVPLRPMLGCVAVAPRLGSASPSTTDSGRWGGNMDFNEIVEGVTVYLPVQTPGALLYVGDGHAAQGDGELNGDALETSMEVEFTVQVISNKQSVTSATRFAATIRTPRVESDSEIMTVGLGGSLEDALREATSGMSQWLEQDYGLAPSEIAQLLGTSVRLNINEAADRNAGVTARLSKQRLQTLARKQ